MNQEDITFNRKRKISDFQGKKIPEEVIVYKILSFLSIPAILNCKLTCKKWDLMIMKSPLFNQAIRNYKTLILKNINYALDKEIKLIKEKKLTYHVPLKYIGACGSTSFIFGGTCFIFLNFISFFISTIHMFFKLMFRLKKMFNIMKSSKKYYYFKKHAYKKSNFLINEYNIHPKLYQKNLFIFCYVKNFIKYFPLKSLLILIFYLLLMIILGCFSYISILQIPVEITKLYKNFSILFNWIKKHL